MSHAGKRAWCYVLEHLADLLGVRREAIPPHVGTLSSLFLTSQEAAEILRTTHRTLLEECRRGSLATIKTGGDWNVSHLFTLAGAVGISLPRPIPKNHSKTDITECSGRGPDPETDITA